MGGAGYLVLTVLVEDGETSKKKGLCSKTDLATLFNKGFNKFQ